MYKHVGELARAAGAVGLKLYTHNTNERAHNAYRDMGMESHEIVFDEIWVQH